MSGKLDRGFKSHPLRQNIPVRFHLVHRLLLFVYLQRLLCLDKSDWNSGPSTVRDGRCRFLALAHPTFLPVRRARRFTNLLGLYKSVNPNCTAGKAILPSVTFMFTIFSLR